MDNITFLVDQLRQPLHVIGMETGTIEAWLKERQLSDDELLEAIQNIKCSTEEINNCLGKLKYE